MSKSIAYKKLFFSILMLLVVVTNFPAYAGKITQNDQMLSNPTIQPYFTNITIFQNYFEISAVGKASVSSYLTGREIDEVRVDASLQQYKNGSWTTIKSWTATSFGTNAGLNGTYYVAKGYCYRLFSNGKVYRNGIVIEQTSYLSESKNYWGG